MILQFLFYKAALTINLPILPNPFIPIFDAINDLF